MIPCFFAGRPTRNQRAKNPAWYCCTKIGIPVCLHCNFQRIITKLSHMAPIICMLLHTIIQFQGIHIFPNEFCRVQECACICVFPLRRKGQIEVSCYQYYLLLSTIIFDCFLRSAVICYPLLLSSPAFYHLILILFFHYLLLFAPIQCDLL